MKEQKTNKGNLFIKATPGSCRSCVQVFLENALSCVREALGKGKSLGVINGVGVQKPMHPFSPKPLFHEQIAQRHMPSFTGSVSYLTYLYLLIFIHDFIGLYILLPGKSKFSQSAQALKSTTLLSILE